MSDKPHGNIQTPSEMLATAQERRMNSKIYSKTSDDGLVVQSIVEQLAIELVAVPKKADLRDTEQIKRICIAYVASCGQAGTIPTKQGLARALGMTRRNLDYFCSIHADHPTAKYLEILFDGFVEALNQAALAKAVDNVTQIFLSKALYGYVDKVTVEQTYAEDPIEERQSAADIFAKYGDIDLPD